MSEKSFLSWWRLKGVQELRSILQISKIFEKITNFAKCADITAKSAVPRRFEWYTTCYNSLKRWTWVTGHLLPYLHPCRFIIVAYNRFDLRGPRDCLSNDKSWGKHPEASERYENCYKGKTHHFWSIGGIQMVQRARPKELQADSDLQIQPNPFVRTFFEVIPNDKLLKNACVSEFWWRNN